MVLFYLLSKPIGERFDDTKGVGLVFQLPNVNEISRTALQQSDFWSASNILAMISGCIGLILFFINFFQFLG